MENTILLSIIIPSYNRHTQLTTLLGLLSHSISNNKLTHIIEVIVIDDASTPALTLPKLPIQLFIKRNAKNEGAPYSREKGFQLSRGKFIHFHDSDDSITPEWLIKIVHTLQKQKNTDLLLTGRIDRTDKGDKQTYKRFFDKNCHKPKAIAHRLLYWNCIGPIGGVIFSRKILEKIPFKRFASSQDWQMYLNALEHAQVLSSQPNIRFIFTTTGNDRISHNPRKKVLGLLQYAHLTEKKSVFKRQIRLFYLYRSRQYIFQQGGEILKFYKLHRGKIFITYLIISAYSFLAMTH